MQIKEISKRHIVFLDETIFDGIFVNMHLIVAENRNYLIDTGMGSESVAYVEAYLNTSGNTNKLVVIVSHDHWDHVWGNGSIETDMIVSHRRTYEVLKETWDQQYDAHKEHQRGEVIKRLPNMVFEDHFVFEDDGIELGFAPAHTDNDIFVYDRMERVLNVIDNLGDSDEDLVPSLQCDKDALLKAIDVYTSFPIEYVISGHNDIRDIKILYALRKELES